MFIFWAIVAAGLVLLQVAGVIALPIFVLLAIIFVPPVLWFGIVIALYALAYWSAFR